MDSRQKIACAGVIMGLGLVMVARKVWARRARNKPSGVWKQVGTVTQLNLYPVKSCRGIPLNECRISSIGMENIPEDGCMALGDRRMVIYKSDSMEMISARTYCHMLQIRVFSRSEDEISLTFDSHLLKVKIPQGKADRKIRLWTEQVPLIDAGDEAAEWLQKYVFDGKPNFRLGFWPGVEVRRDISHLVKKYEQVYPFMRNDFTGAFSDLSSFLLLNESSVEDLNDKIAQKSQDQDSNEDPAAVSIDNFRGNFVIRGPSAYEEDNWSWVRIGDRVVFRNYKPCTRCSLTTIDKETSIKNKHFEPLTTLKTYRLLDEKKRKLDPSPAMGIYMGLWTDGQTNDEIIRVGDPVYVCE
uniref:MOSC domain-containing protein 1, mitochondrial n=1 Tax=Lygus hesperus TaxID=30085 RepID=A0A146MGM7_LYGHE